MEFVVCTVGMVYCILLECGKKYVGQTTHLNGRLRAHDQIRKKIEKTLEGHLTRCMGCGLDLKNTEILHKNKKHGVCYVWRPRQ